ncbi:hypothetical protein FDP41_008749 [Naegleria fowleri]|uniref:non-specific serine/threonine protein kinase n=1 Tax=Naegleria fowleri TaxID=5763 RepID=A0A6A5B4K7_NAEFO|nr:uncharacterized protein FDP41_008749 [Naegleria fowleri]KAF0972897.1 hypothetical protein FDP41_008749 [Naegleria fowleri]
MQHKKKFNSQGIQMNIKPSKTDPASDRLPILSSALPSYAYGSSADLDVNEHQSLLQDLLERKYNSKYPNCQVSIEFIASGTYGMVFKVQADDEIFAVKMVRKDSKKKYENEKKPHSLKYDHIVKINEVFEEKISGQVTIIGLEMKYYEQSLSTLFPNNNMPEIVAIQVLSQLSQALSYVHELGVLHRDIKSENILVEEYTTRWKIKVVLSDFSLCRDKQSVIEGTPKTAPELASPTAADIYSLGCMIRELCSNSFLSPQFKHLLSKMTSDSISERPTASGIEEHLKKTTSQRQALEVVHDFYRHVRNQKVERGLNMIRDAMFERIDESKQRRKTDLSLSKVKALVKIVVAFIVLIIIGLSVFWYYLSTNNVYTFIFISLNVPLIHWICLWYGDYKYYSIQLKVFDGSEEFTTKQEAIQNAISDLAEMIKSFSANKTRR